MYETYELSRKEWGIYGAEGILGIAVMDYVFYRNAGLFLVLLPIGMLFPLMLRKQLKKRRLETLRGQFKDAILAVASGLNAGYSVENAFAVSLKEMEEIHGSDSMIAKEIRLILRKVRLNLTFEEALGDFAKRSGLDDVKNFSDVFLAARKSGGELMKIIARTAAACRSPRPNTSSHVSLPDYSSSLLPETATKRDAAIPAPIKSSHMAGLVWSPVFGSSSAAVSAAFSAIVASGTVSAACVSTPGPPIPEPLEPRPPVPPLI